MRTEAAEGPATRVNVTDRRIAGLLVGRRPSRPDNYMVVWSGSATGEDAGVFYSEQCPRRARRLVLQQHRICSGTPVVQNVADQRQLQLEQRNSPATGVNGAYWSGTWAGMIKANTSEAYTFYATADDGVRLYVNGHSADRWLGRSGRDDLFRFDQHVGRPVVSNRRAVLQQYGLGEPSSWNGPARAWLGK